MIHLLIHPTATQTPDAGSPTPAVQHARKRPAEDQTDAQERPPNGRANKLARTDNSTIAFGVPVMFPVLYGHPRAPSATPAKSSEGLKSGRPVGTMLIPATKVSGPASVNRWLQPRSSNLAPSWSTTPLRAGSSAGSRLSSFLPGSRPPIRSGAGTTSGVVSVAQQTQFFYYFYYFFRTSSY